MDHALARADAAPLPEATRPPLKVLVVDDSASAFDVNNRSRIAITATMTLEVKVKGTTDILSKTFLNLDGVTLSDVLSSLGNDGPKLADSALNVNETALIGVVNNSQMMTQLLFQSGDATIAQGLRDLLQTTGTPVVTVASDAGLYVLRFARAAAVEKTLLATPSLAR